MTNHNNRGLSVPWNMADAAQATGLVLVSFLVLLLILRPVIGALDEEDRAHVIPWLAGVTEGVLLATVWAFGVGRYRSRWQVVGLRSPRTRRSYLLALAALLGSLAFTSIYATVVAALGADYLLPSPIPDDALGQGLLRLLNTLVIALWVPFVEETFFRGFLLAAMVLPLGAPRAVVVSSAIFAVTHLDIGAMIPIFVTGMLLSLLYLRSRSLWPPIAAHAAQNLLAVSVGG